MNIFNFRKAVFKKRGDMNPIRVHNHLIQILNTPMAIQAVEYKRLGLARLAEIATTYTHDEQRALNTWLDENKQAKKKEIELFITSLGDES